MLLEGKSAVVTGAGSGVGRASALRFAEEGAKVVVADVDLERAKETVQLDRGRRRHRGRRSVRRVPGGRRRRRPSRRGLEHFGRLDIMFNNVGIPTPRLGLIFEEHTVDDFDRLFAVNVGGRVPRLQARHPPVQAAG